MSASAEIIIFPIEPLLWFDEVSVKTQNLILLY